MATKYNYVVTLKNQQNKYLDGIGFLLGLLSAIFFIREMVLSSSVGLAYLLGSIFIIGVLIWNAYQSWKNHKRVYYSRALLIAALVWMKMPYFQWLTFVFIILALLEYQAKYSVEIGFSDDEIVINTLMKKRYRWSGFNHIVLKDGILTMDFANNRRWQREVEDDEEDDADEEEFNAYCSLQLSKVQAARV